MKKYNRKAIQKMLYDTINSLTNDSDFYYKSAVGDEYSRLTAEGEQQLLNLISNMIPLIDKCEDEQFMEDAKEATYDTLKESTDTSE